MVSNKYSNEKFRLEYIYKDEYYIRVYFSSPLAYETLLVVVERIAHVLYLTPSRYVTPNEKLLQRRATEQSSAALEAVMCPAEQAL